MRQGPPRRAIVVGGSVAGLLAAAALRRHVPRVTVIEREPDAGEGPRRAVPQGCHVHALLLGGAGALERLLPSIGEDLREAGAPRVDFAADCRFHHFGVRKPQFVSDLRGLLPGRPLLETTLRRRVLGLEGIELRRGLRISGLVRAPGRGAVAGVTVAGPRGERTLEADWVVDASGRGSRLVRWLADHGVEAPPEHLLHLGLTYASRLYRPPPGERDWSALFVYPRQPRERRGGFIFPLAPDRWLVSLIGYSDPPPATAAGFEAFAASLPSAELHHAIRAAEPCSEVERLRVPVQRWRRFDRCRGLPAGLVVIGDALCCLDPLFGQGMTLAALEAEILGDCLAGSPGRRAAASHRYHRRCRRLLRTPWRMTTMEALRYPSVFGHRPPATGVFQAYAARIFELSADDPEVYRAFLRVMHFLAPLSTLFRPSVLWRVARFRPRRAGETLHRDEPSFGN